MLNYMKKILLIAIMLLVILGINSCIYAADSEGGSGSSVMSGLITDLDAGSADDPTAEKVEGIVATVITVVRVVGVAVAIVMLLVVAMKYMTAAPGEKADIKKSAVVYVVGAVVLFAVTGILGLINTFASAIS